MKRFVMPLLPFSQIEDRSMEKRTELRKIVLRSRLFFGFLAVFMALIVFATTKFHLEHLSLETLGGPFASSKDMELDRFEFSGSLPRGIVESNSVLELKSLGEDSRLKGTSENYTALLAIPVGIKQKQNVDVIVQKFLSDNCSVILFHYDGNVDGWNDLEWSNKVIHILALNQTKWWFAKRFLHPDIVSIYDYIFLWDEDLGVENFHPRRFVVQGAHGSAAQLIRLGLLHRLLGPMGQYTACINTESIFCQAPSTYHFRALFDKMFSMILKPKQLLLFHRLTFVASMF